MFKKNDSDHGKKDEDRPDSVSSKRSRSPAGDSDQEPSQARKKARLVESSDSEDDQPLAKPASGENLSSDSVNSVILNNLLYVLTLLGGHCRYTDCTSAIVSLSGYVVVAIVGKKSLDIVISKVLLSLSWWAACRHFNVVCNREAACSRWGVLV